jgi:hypothetical protein
VRDSGHLLLAILLMMAFMVIAATYEAPRMVQQLKRDREEEMIHRGTEYARAIKKYYKKMGSYPSTIEQLENTNNIRFLRKRYKDPESKDGKWTLLHYNDVAASLVTAGAPGTPAAALGSGAGGPLGSPAGQQNSSPFSSSLGSSNTNSASGFGTSSFGGANSQPAVNQNGIFSQGQSSSGSSTGQQTVGGSATNNSASQNSSGSNSSGGIFGSPAGATTDPNGNPNGANAALGGGQSLAGGQFGAGAIMGVASKSKDPTIRIYNKKKTYDEWQFIYNPVMDQANVLLKGPYSPSAFAGNTNIGTPAGQLNQQNPQQSPFGQQNSPFGSQQPGGYNNQQPVTPGGQQFPPDQSH